MLKKIRQALVRKGYTADEIELLLKSFTELLDKLRKKARTSEDGQAAHEG
jgi:SOS response regulatory protein OraA/RecX